MLDPVERASVAAEFGVSDEQVERDHLISHLLVALAQGAAESVVFFGGTALARTHLSRGRLSEDLDLLAVGPRTEVVERIDEVLGSGARRSHGRLTWSPPLGSVRSEEHGVLVTTEGLAVRVQLLDPTGRTKWPTEVRSMVQRYSDVSEARLTVPTLAAFVAAKTAAWIDRGAPRDLFDLHGLAERGAIDSSAAQIFAQLGPTHGLPQEWMFTSPPNERDWATELSGQTRLEISAQDACDRVRVVWGGVTRSIEGR